MSNTAAAPSSSPGAGNGLTSSTLVNVADDAELRLVGLVADAASVPTDAKNAFKAACEESVRQTDAAQLLLHVLSFKDDRNVALVSAMADTVRMDDEAAVSACSLACEILNRVLDHTKASHLLDRFCSALLSYSPPSHERNNEHKHDSNKDNLQRSVRKRLALLMATLYNMRSRTHEKVFLLTKIVQLVSDTSGAPSSLLETPGTPLARLLATVTVDAESAPKRVPRLVALLNEWNVPTPQRRDLYQSLADGVVDHTAKQRFLILLVATFVTEDSVDATALKYAKLAAIGAIRDPVTLFDEQRPMLSYPAIKALRSTDAKLYQLLEIVQQKQLSDYEAYIKSNAPLDDSWGIDTDKCMANMRILSLCTLASSNQVSPDDHSLPYDVIAKTLHLDGNDTDKPSSVVESWVIKAMNSGLLQAKMDQLNQVVLVERAVLRSFDMDQWKQLQAKLHTWKEHVGSILTAYRQQQQQQHTEA